MSKYSKFIFKDYKFDKNTKELNLRYSYDDNLELTETYKFDFEFIDYDVKELDQALQLLFFMAGVSYYKMYLVQEIEIRKGKLDNELAEFFSDTYLKGLRELFYVNKLDINFDINFPHNTDQIEKLNLNTNSSGQFVSIGGGKDSLVSAEILRDQPKVATWSLSHMSQLEPLINKIGLKHYWVERTIDNKISELNKADAYNGHVPFSAILSCVGLVVCILTGFKDNVMSNEDSANEATLEVNGLPVNHQYSKSIEYEEKYQKVISKLFGNSYRYYSLLRSLSEINIAEIFAKNYFNKYKEVFSSCNRAFTQIQDKMIWCSKCSKCAFIFLALTPFINRAELENIWGGKNLLLDSSLEPIYKQLIGIEGEKPLDCVGEIKESRKAMRLAQSIYPELKKYDFYLPNDYDYKKLHKNLLPPDIEDLFKNKYSNLLK